MQWPLDRQMTLTASLQRFGLATRPHASRAGPVRRDQQLLTSTPSSTWRPTARSTQRDLGDRLLAHLGRRSPCSSSRLEARPAFVHRRKHPTDRRYLLIELTPRALEAIPEGLANYHASVHRLANDVPVEHRAAVESLFEASGGGQLRRPQPRCSVESCQLNPNVSLANQRQKEILGSSTWKRRDLRVLPGESVWVDEGPSLAANDDPVRAAAVRGDAGVLAQGAASVERQLDLVGVSVELDVLAAIALRHREAVIHVELLGRGNVGGSDEKHHLIDLPCGRAGVLLRRRGDFPDRAVWGL